MTGLALFEHNDPRLHPDVRSVEESIVFVESGLAIRECQPSVVFFAILDICCRASHGIRNEMKADRATDAYACSITYKSARRNANLTKCSIYCSTMSICSVTVKGHIVHEYSRVKAVIFICVNPRPIPLYLAVIAAVATHGGNSSPYVSAPISV